MSTHLQKMHDRMAEVLADGIDKGVPVRDDETGEVHFAPMSAAHMAIAMALLKHNNISAIPTDAKKGLGKLQASMSSMPIPGADMQTFLHGKQ